MDTCGLERVERFASTSMKELRLSEESRNIATECPATVVGRLDV
jgi:hypothetical protein